MKYPLTEEQTILQDSVVAFLAANHDTARCRRFRADKRGFDPVFWSKIAEMGWLAMSLPERLDGLGLSIDDVAILLKQFGACAVMDPYVVNCLMPAVVLSSCENERATQLASRLISGEGAISMMAVDSPVLIKAGRVTQRFEVYLATSDSPILALADDDGIRSIVAIEPSAPGTVIEVFPQHDGTMTATVDIQDIDINRCDVLLAGEGAGAAWKRAIREGTIALCSQLAGVSRGLLDLTVGFAKQRIQFGQPISHFQVIQHRLVNLYIAVQLAESSYRKALRVYGEEAYASDAAIHAAKARASEVALDVARAAIQIHGAMGYTEECDVACYFRSAMTLSQQLGNSAQHRQRVWSLARLPEPVVA